MHYFLDCEFNGFGGDLISLALAADDGRELYLVSGHETPTPWVAENVIPLLDCTGEASIIRAPRTGYGRHLLQFLRADRNPVIVADWPEDIRHFCDAMILKPGQAINLPRVTFDLVSADTYPTDLPGAVQHNALWDARALRHALTAHQP